MTSADGVTQAGQAVDGTFAISSFRVVDGAITAIGTFTGTVAGGATQTVEASAPVAALAPGATCEILDLTLDPLHLDLLGLVVDLDTVNLQITAVPGAGNLLRGGVGGVPRFGPIDCVVCATSDASGVDRVLPVRSD